MKQASRYILNASLVLGSIVFTLALAEVLFRTLLYFGLINTVTETYSTYPYGYYLWSREGGYPSGINNRYGYADQDFDVKKRPGVKRIAIIGDSFVEALQVGIPNKMGPVLQSRLNMSSPQQYEVMSFGRSGEYPAYYFERLKKIASRFSPDIVFVLIYMGNDFRNASIEIENRASGATPAQYIFYEKDHAGSIWPHPQSIPLIESFAQKEMAAWSRQPHFLQRMDILFRRVSLLYSEVPARLDILKRNLHSRSVEKNKEFANGDFKKGSDRWKADNDAKLVVTEQNQKQLLNVINSDAGGSNGYAKQIALVEPGAVYSFQITLQKGSAESNPAIYVGVDGAEGKYLQYSLAKKNQYRFTANFIPGNPRVSILLQVGSMLPAQYAAFSDASLKKIQNANIKECNEETIYLKSYDSCWSDSKFISKELIRKMQRYADISGVKLFFVGIPANESYWGDPLIKKIAASYGPVTFQTDYDKFLAKKHSVADADVDLVLPNKLFNKIMGDSGVQYVDLYDKFYNELTKNQRKVYCRVVNGHLCEEGHQIVATEMARLVGRN